MSLVRDTSPADVNLDKEDQQARKLTHRRGNASLVLNFFF